MELTGKVTLDEKTMEALKDVIRKEVIEDIRKNGNYGDEIEIYVKDLDYERYVNLIKMTIKSIVEKTKDEDIHFESGRKAFKKLLAIQAILGI